jgi:hypothetical protein
MPRVMLPTMAGVQMRGRPATAKPYTWTREAWIVDEFHPQGILEIVKPMPGRTYVKATWPPRGRGRGESLWSDRRIEAKMRALEVLKLRPHMTYAEIARRLGFKDASGPYRAYRRLMDRALWDERRRAELKKARKG